MRRRPLFVAAGALACGAALWLASRPPAADEQAGVAPARVEDRFARPAPGPETTRHEPVRGSEPTSGETPRPPTERAQTEPPGMVASAPEPVAPEPVAPMAGSAPSTPTPGHAQSSASAVAEPSPAERWVEEYGVPDPEHERHMIDVRRERSLDVVERLMAGLAEQQEEAQREGDTERAQKLAESVRRLEWRHRVLDGQLAEAAGMEEGSAPPSN